MLKESDLRNEVNLMASSRINFHNSNFLFLSFNNEHCMHSYTTSLQIEKKKERGDGKRTFSFGHEKHMPFIFIQK